MSQNSAAHVLNDRSTCFDKLSELLSRKDAKAAIFMHITPDIDAIGSAIGIRYVLMRKFGIASDIFHAGEVSHRQNQTLVNVLSLSFMHEKKYIEMKENYNIRICVDCNPANVGIQELAKTGVNLIIDHHRIEPPEGVVADVRVTGSCASIVWDIMDKLDCIPDGDDAKTIATAMVIGIRKDTMDFLSSSLTELDFKAYKSLLPLADFQKVQLIINFPKAKYYYDLLSRAVKEGTTVNTTFIASVGLISEGKRDALPDIADDIVRMEGISTSVIFGIIDDRISVSVRSEDVALDVNAFCKRVFGDEFSGGKYGAGGASIPLGFMSGLTGDPVEVKDKLVEAIKSKIVHLVGKEVKSDT